VKKIRMAAKPRAWPRRAIFCDRRRGDITAFIDRNQNARLFMIGAKPKARQIDRKNPAAKRTARITLLVYDDAPLAQRTFALAAINSMLERRIFRPVFRVFIFLAGLRI
jgi:hypothetical protein